MATTNSKFWLSSAYFWLGMPAASCVLFFWVYWDFNFFAILGLVFTLGFSFIAVSMSLLSNAWSRRAWFVWCFAQLVMPLILYQTNFPIKLFVAQRNILAVERQVRSGEIFYGNDDLGFGREVISSDVWYFHRDNVEEFRCPLSGGGFGLDLGWVLCKSILDQKTKTFNVWINIKSRGSYDLGDGWYLVWFDGRM